MKIRNGFVSNSSSCSFTINLSDLTEEQINMIVNHIKIGRKIKELALSSIIESFFDDEPDLIPDCLHTISSFRYTYPEEDRNAWDIDICKSSNKLKGKTNMTNFDMDIFLDLIGVDDKIVDWEEY